MTTILHLIQQLTLGGAARSLVATSKYSALQGLGAYRHRVVSLAPAEADARALAREADLEVIDAPHAKTLLREIEQADVVQVHWWNNAILQKVLHWDLPPLRLLMWYHVAGQGVPQIITPELVRMADLNVATNPFTYYELPVFRYMPASERSRRLEMIYDPADFARLEGLEPRLHPYFNVGYIGTVDFFKMHPRYVPMSASVKIPDVRFVVCGGGLEEQLKAQAQALGAGDRFDFRGYVKDIRPVLEILDVYGYPLCEQTYASGELNLQEAMFAGVPPVAFPHGGLKRLIVHEFTGLLVETERAYRQALEFLYHHPEEVGRLGRNAREFALQVFGAENAARKLNPLYDRLMGEPKRPRCWGTQAAESILDQPVQIRDLASDSQTYSGAELFLESLGSQAGEFLSSRTETDLTAALAADQAVASASRLVQYTGVFAYRIGYPEDPWLAFWGALAGWHQGDVRAALKDLALAVRHGFPHPRVYWHLALAAEEAGERKLALEALQTFLPFAPDWEKARDLQGRLLRRPKEANVSPDSSEPPQPDSGAAATLRRITRTAQEQIRAGQLEAAHGSLSEALRLHPSDPELHLALGSLDYQLGHLESARDRLRWAAPHFDRDADLWAVLADVYGRLGCQSGFESALDQALTLNPKHPEALFLLATARFQAERIPEAGRLCSAVLEAAPNHLEALELLARCFLRGGDADSVRLTCQRLLELAPEHPGARSLLQSLLAAPSSSEKDPVKPDSQSLPPEPAVPAAESASGPPSKPGTDGGINGAERPLVSVLVSTCNTERFLPACLEDLEAQTLARRLEIIVIDSGSEQNEAAVVREFQERHDNIRYLRTERETLYAAWNRGLELARGRFVANANTDDAHHPEALEKLVAALEAHPEADLAYGDVIDTSVPNDSYRQPSVVRRVSHPPFHPALALFYCPLGCHPLWRKDAFEKLGPFDATYHGPGDYEFLLRFVQAGLKAVHVPETLSLFYKNPRGLSFQSLARARSENDRIQSKYRAEMPIERLFKLNPEDARERARGWTALGNLAMNHEVPWFSNPQHDHDYARQCYTQALHSDPGCEAAIHNLLILRALHGQLKNDDPILDQIPPDLAGDLRAALASGQFDLLPVDLPPAVPPLEFPTRTLPDQTNPARPEPPPAIEKPAAAASLASPVRWVAPFLSATDDGAESRNFVLPLMGKIPLGTYDCPEPEADLLRARLPDAEKQTLRDTRRRFSLLCGGVAVVQLPADQLVRIEGADYQIGRVGTEADGLPLSGVTKCNQMDEIWVPSQFHLETLASSGVEADKLRVMPSPVDSRLFHPDQARPLPLPRRAAFNFLAVFSWSDRAAWDVLLKAYLQEFNGGDDVCLYLRTWLPDQPEAPVAKVLSERIQTFIRRHHLQKASFPRVQILEETRSEEDRPGLYRAADCLVAPFRGENCGRAQIEAMLTGLPVIGTAWGGFAEHLNEAHSWRIDYELVPVKTTEAALWHNRGHRWAQPSIPHLRQLLRQVQTHPEIVREKGRNARAYAERTFSREAVSGRVLDRLAAIAKTWAAPVCLPVSVRSSRIEPALKPENTKPIRVAWEGSFLDLGSLSHVNRELTRALSRQPGIRLTCVGKNNLNPSLGGMTDLKEMAGRLQAAPARKCQFTVRHGWPPDWQPPASGDWILIQPWEYGVLPEDWVSHLARVQEMWVPSNFVRRTFVDSGVDPGKVKVVPNGIDPARFHPGIAPLELATRKSFKFLFVGGTIHRKGPDLLLEAYLEQFTSADDVCLVIKDFGGQDVYRGQTIEDQIRRAQAGPRAPEILYLNEDLPPEALPALYTACDALVHPYRGEGFGLPVLEAMACGLPVIVTGGGATDDFATDELAYRLPARRRSFGGQISGLKLVRPGWLLEPDRTALAGIMKTVSLHREAARDKGRRASDYVRREWTWDKAAEVASQLLRNRTVRRTQEENTLAARRAKRAPQIQLPAVARLGHLGQARELWRAQNLAAAWETTLGALRTRPFHPEAYLLLAEIARTAGEAGLAKRCAEQALTLAPRWKPARQFLKAPLSPPCPVSWKPPLNFNPRSSHPPRLTVCVIAKNEERFIGQCLESVRAIAEQVIVLDTGSTDWTVTFAERFGAEVYSFDWSDDFSAARNAALQHATGDWILMLDADEALSSSGREQLTREMETAQVMAWRLPIVDVGREEEGSNYVPRLFRNAPGLFYVGRVHEQVFTSLEVLRAGWGLENRLGQTRLIHYGYTDEILRQRQKIARNLALLEQAIEEMPNEPNLLLNHGLELIRSGRWQAGLEQYGEAFHLLSAQPPAERVPELVETLLTQFSSHLLQHKGYRAVADLLGSPLARAAGLTASLHFSQGLALMELKQYGDAAQQMRQCLTKRDQPSLTPLNPEIKRAGPRHCLAICQWKQKQIQEAKQTFSETLHDFPQSRPLRQDYGLFLADAGLPVEALTVFHQLVTEQPGDLLSWIRGGEIALSRPDFAEFANDWSGEAIKHFSRHPAILTLRAQALLYRQETAAALDLWRQLPALSNARHRAAQILCELVEDVSPNLHSVFEPAVSQEFITWYRHLIKAGADDLIHTLNRHMEQIRQILPSAGRILDQAFAEAENEAAV
jgi:glycosyltransferase involved in cell wall biosynthesis/Tfp pilus assembly protein PilF